MLCAQSKPTMGTCLRRCVLVAGPMSEADVEVATTGTPHEPLLDRPDASSEADIRVHDAARLAWDVPIPIEDASAAGYSFDLEIEIPVNLLPVQDPWTQLQSYARLDGLTATGPGRESEETVRADVLAASVRLGRARDGFVRHCAAERAGDSDCEHGRALALWVQAAVDAVAATRLKLASTPPEARPKSVNEECGLADEYLSGQLWTALTDCARALHEIRPTASRDESNTALAQVEPVLLERLKAEIAHRKQAGFPSSEAVNERQFERLLQRARWLKKHFQRVLFLESQTYQIAERLQSWFTVAAAMVAYLWFFVWQLLAERRLRASPTTLSSGLVAFALLTSIAYASREKLKEAARNWLAGRVQRLFSQRMVTYRLPRKGRAPGPAVAKARESFSQSTAERLDPIAPESGSIAQVTVVRFAHRGSIRVAGTPPAREIRHVFRYDLSALLPRLHDAFRGLARPDTDSKRIVITDVPQNYELPVRLSLRVGPRTSQRSGVVVLNKNGLLRFEADDQPPG